MTESSRLKTILHRIEAGKRLNKQELQMLVAAVRLEQVTIATGDRAVAIGGSADGAVIITGDRNFVISNADAESLRQVMGIRPRSEQILLKASKEEVNSRLKQSLHNATLMNLEMESQSDQIAYPWHSEIKIGDQLIELIPESWNIQNVFDEAQGKLLILGSPGAGKTTTLLDLAKALIVQAEEDANMPIPVLFNLSNWQSDQKSIHDWLISELKSRPFCSMSEKNSRQLLQEKRLLPLLDGLDEMRPGYQEACVVSINKFVNQESSPQYLVVCSRREEYSNYTARLQLHGAICLKDLDASQVRSYLAKMNRIDLWEIMQKDRTLMELVHTPFWLSILVLSEQELRVGEWLALKTTKDRLDCLLAAYVRRMFARSLKNNPYQKEPGSEQSKIWLVWIAQQLNQNFQSEFLIEALQPHQLMSQDLEKKYLLSLRLGFDMVFGGMFGLFVFLSDKLVLQSIIAGAVMVWAVDRKSEFYQEIQTVERFGWSWLRAKIALKIIFFIASIILPAIIAIVYYAKLKSNLLLGILFTVGFLACIGLGSGFFGIEIELKDSKNSNQGIWNSLTISLIFSLVGGVLLGLEIVFGTSINSQIGNWFLAISGAIMLLGSMTGLIFGGYACIQHFFLRFLLFFQRVIPWNYARFLDYATDRLLLQRVGGRYRFIHRLLQEHFATMPLEPLDR
jgi:DNA polymerase III delta prime subunit